MTAKKKEFKYAKQKLMISNSNLERFYVLRTRKAILCASEFVSAGLGNYTSSSTSHHRLFLLSKSSKSVFLFLNYSFYISNIFHFTVK